jgi:hypothetical protein
MRLVLQCEMLWRWANNKKIFGMVVWIASKIRIATGLNVYGFKDSGSCTQGLGKRDDWILNPSALVQQPVPNIWT